MSDIAWLRSPEKTLEADWRIGQSEAPLAGQVHWTVQSVAFTKKRQGGRLVIRTSCFGSANQKASEHTSDEPQDRSFVSANHIIQTDHPSDKSSAQQITCFGRIILRTNLRLIKSHPSDGLSFGRIFGSANHILRTDHPVDKSSARPITSF